MTRRPGWQPGAAHSYSGQAHRRHGPWDSVLSCPWRSRAEARPPARPRLPSPRPPGSIAQTLPTAPAWETRHLTKVVGAARFLPRGEREGWGTHSDPEGAI